MPKAVEARLLELRQRFPEWGPIRLRHQLAREGVSRLPGRTSIYRALRRNQLVTYTPRRRRRADYQRWERDRPMELWQLDIMGGVMLADGTECKLISGVDDASRYCVLAHLVIRPPGRAVAEAFLAAMSRYGLPEEVLTDNGKQFTGRFGPHPAEVLFERACRHFDIAHRKTGVGDGDQQVRGDKREVAVHGSTSVPTYPASHGCVRVTIPAMNRLWPKLRIGMPVWVYR